MEGTLREGSKAVWEDHAFASRDRIARKRHQIARTCRVANAARRPASPTWSERSAIRRYGLCSARSLME